MKKSSKDQGFTLLEVVIAMAIMGILSIVAYPLLSNWLPNIQFRRATRSLYTDMQFAKMEAIKRNTNVVIQINSVACPGLPAAVPIPGGGYRVFVDTNGNGAEDAGEALLANELMPSNIALCGNTFGGGGGNAGFTGNGLPLGGALGTLTLNNNRNYTSSIALSLTGNIRIQ